MNDGSSVPCTAVVLTRNSALTLARALDSIKNFNEIIVCDGDSNDATAEIARLHGARVLRQDAQFLESDGRIRDFSGIRNQCIEASANDWIFFLDSDEYASPELIGDLSHIEEEKPSVYWVPRKYVLNSRIIERSVAYPNQQMRIFHKKAVRGYRKPVHERLEIHDGYPVHTLHGAILVPADINKAEMKKKSDRYIEIELNRQAPISLGAVWRIGKGSARTILRYVLRLPGVLFGKGERMPLAQDLLAIRYQFLLFWRSVERFFTS